MTKHELDQMTKLGHEAAQISALLSIISTHLFNEPETALVSGAIDGVQLLASRLSTDLYAIGDAE